ncbi:hypothetical protein JAAARDRAFT_196237 [Jaapia argillacea MUCL 33604]|uniref:Mid2 domain-containing protein n=1 Tax=Jaapia argillacea MUCL 33604 TaxID=933084 RepID=A0A067PU79_9AGAM|nr:hypothetical protein JAAARDRAFT_196237 [Jaapia argillacea MUCL 33604]
MGASYFRLATAALWTGCFLTFTPAVKAKFTPFLEQGFYFDFAPASQAVPIPTTAQCDPIHLSWSRGSATGPNPNAPYYLQVYTSTFVVPFIIPAGNGLTFDWIVPFIPGTQFQICMFDANGVPGGCQRQYTVIPAINSTLDNPPVCQNLTYPASALDVQGAQSLGSWSQYGWPDQCTDLSITPKNGTPPFTLTIAPTLHPPANITSNSMAPINWTVSLSWGSPFYISLVDSQGNTWANGPLHSGGGGPTACLAQTDTVSGGSGLKPVVAIGTGVGGLALGALLGGLIAYFCSRPRGESHDDMDRVMPVRKTSDLDGGVHGFSSTSHQVYSSVPTAEPTLMSSANTRSFATTLDTRHTHNTIGSFGSLRAGGGGQYHIEPFVMPSETSHVTHPGSPPPTSPIHTPGPVPSLSHSNAESSTSRNAGRRNSERPNVYVVHHDGGRAPVTVYADNGAEIVELPPRYLDERSEAGGGGGGSRSERAPSDAGRSDGRSEGRSEAPSFRTLEPQRRSPGAVRKPQDSARTPPADPSSNWS